MPTLGVITVTYNAADFVAGFLACCVAQTHADFELLVIDNASSDTTVERLRQMLDPRIHVVANDDNIGYAAACNQGMRHFLDRGAENILFINNDTEFGCDLFEALVRTRERHAAAAITPRITYAGHEDVNWYAGGRFTYWKGFQGEHLGAGRRQPPGDIEPRWTPVAPGCCILFAAATLARVGPFDPGFFVYFEDTDYFLRMRAANLRLLYAPGTVIRHKVSLSTGGPQSDFSIRYYQRNQIYIIRKHHGAAVVASQLLIISLKAILRLLAGRDNLRQFRIRFRSIREGFLLPVVRARA